MARGAPVRAPDSFGAADARCGRAERGIRVGHETVRRWVANFDEHGQALDALV